MLVLDDVHHLRSPEALDVVDGDRRRDAAGLAGRARRPPRARPPDRPPACAGAADRAPGARPRDDAARGGDDAEPGGSRAPARGRARAARAHRGLAGRALHRRPVAATARPDLHRAVARFGGDDRLLADYLRDELLDGLDAEQLRFLERTSVLDELSGAGLRRGPAATAAPASCCATCRARTCSSSRSTRCRRVLPLPRAPRAACCGPSCVATRPGVRGRAAPAGERLVRAAPATPIAPSSTRSTRGDVARAGALLWATAARVLDGRAADVRRWLGSLHARADRVAADARAHRGRPPPRRRRARPGRALDRGRRAARSTATTRASLDAGVQAMRAAVARDGIAAMRRDAESGYERLPEDSPWRSLCCLLRRRRRAPAGRRRRGPAAARGGRAARRDRGADRPGALPRPARPARHRRRRLGAGRRCSPRARGRRWSASASSATRPARSSSPCRRSSARIATASTTPRPTGAAPSSCLTQLVDYVPWYDVEVRRRARPHGAPPRGRHGHADAARARPRASWSRATTSPWCCEPGSTSCGPRSRRSR